MLEQKIQKKISDKLEKEGWFVVKLIKTNKNGVPDLLATKGKDCMFIEVKNKKGILSPLQIERIEEIRASGTIVKIWTDYGLDFSEREQVISKF